MIKKRYFVEIERVEQLGEILRKSVAPLLEKEVIVEAPKLYAYDLEYLSLLSLRVGLDQLNLPDLYDEIYPLAMIVSSFRSVYFEKQPVGLIELLMAVQDCLAICMIKRMPEVSYHQSIPTNHDQLSGSRVLLQAGILFEILVRGVQLRSNKSHTSPSTRSSASSDCYDSSRRR